MAWHGYFGIENLALNAGQKAQLVAGLRALGPAADPQPARLNHWRSRPDGEAALFEALFPDNALSVQAFKQRLGSIFSVDPAEIQASTESYSFGGYNTAVVTLAYAGTDRLRVALFGGVGATWPISNVEVRGYLAAAGGWDDV